MTRLPKLNSVLDKAYNKISLKSKFVTNTRLKHITSIQPNLGSILLNNFKIPISKKYCCACELPNCKICYYINNSFSIVIRKFDLLPILANVNCNALNAVYIIHCKRCDKYYTGQTKDVKRRILEHIRDIKNFKPYESKRLCVAIHFNLKRHILHNDFSFFIIYNNLNDLQQRLAYESFFINIFYNIDQSLVINDFIPKLFYKKTNVITF